MNAPIHRVCISRRKLLDIPQRRSRVSTPEFYTSSVLADFLCFSVYLVGKGNSLHAAFHRRYSFEVWNVLKNRVSCSFHTRTFRLVQRQFFEFLESLEFHIFLCLSSPPPSTFFLFPFSNQAFHARRMFPADISSSWTKLKTSIQYSPRRIYRASPVELRS